MTSTSTNHGASGNDEPMGQDAGGGGGVPATEHGVPATEYGVPTIDTGVPTDGDVPTDKGAPTGGDVPADGGVQTDRGAPRDGSAPTDADAPAAWYARPVGEQSGAESSLATAAAAVGPGVPAASPDVTAIQDGLPNIAAVVPAIEAVVAAAEHGVPAAELSDEDLEHQGAQTHLTRNWVFLHGTAEQFQTHTARMLELEQEYLRRHPKRTWQGTEAGQPGDERDLLVRFAATPDGRMHKLEAHHAARELGLRPERVAALHRQDPPLLTTRGDYRVLTDAGRAWLAAQT